MMADVIDEVRAAPAESRRPEFAVHEAGERPPVPTRRRPRRVLRASLFALGAAILIIGGLWYFISGGRYVSTTDAYVQSNVLTVSTDVSGIVDRIYVSEGQHVNKGQILFRLDSDKFRIALDDARANLAQTALTLQSLKAEYQRSQRQVSAQLARVQDDQDTYNRYAALVQHHAITEQQFDDAKYKLAADQAVLGGNQANVKSVLARLGGNAGAPIEQMPSYQQAQSQLAEAQREYDHSIVRAPFAGVVTQVNKLQPGQFLGAGTAAFGLVQTTDMWVAAEPKETALTYVRPGQAATVTVDAYPGETWHGTVQSVAAATDQEFSVLPAQNSSGNWVKVVQRVPVRVDIKPDPNQPPLSAGMSAEVAIDTHHGRTLGDLF
jgi:membrane fusion protein, multidrug efflux system